MNCPIALKSFVTDPTKTAIATITVPPILILNTRRTR